MISIPLKLPRGIWNQHRRSISERQLYRKSNGLRDPHAKWNPGIQP